MRMILLGLALLLTARAQAVSLYGATNADTSEVMLGKIAVGLVWVSTPQESWTAEDAALQRKVRNAWKDALRWWTGEAKRHGVEPPDFQLRTPDFETRVSVNPLNWARRPSIKHWVPEALEGISPRYQATDALRGAERLANDLRAEMDSHWAFVVFVLKGKAFADGRNHFVHRHGGPFVTILAGALSDTGARHEMGHVFHAKDEYYEAKFGCERRTGYFDVPNLYAETDASLVCSGATPNERCPEVATRPMANECGMTMVRSIMRRSRGADVRDGISPAVMGAIGWLEDEAGNNLFLDTQPRLKHVERTANGLTAWAADTPRHPGAKDGKPKAISITPITRIEYGRVGESGWTEVTPADGAADRPVEMFQIVLPPSDNPWIQIRLTNARGVSTVHTLEMTGGATEADGEKAEESSGGKVVGGTGVEPATSGL